MTKLDEMEVNFFGGMNDKELEDTFSLLFRAVRQLEVFVEYAVVYTNDGKVRKNSPIDLDVLELFDE